MGWAIVIISFILAGALALLFFVCTRNIKVTNQRDAALKKVEDLEKKMNDITEVENEKVKRISVLHNTPDSDLADYANTQYMPNDPRY